jgi:phosphatidylinositol alpha-1,6-mannosyltransferase
LAGPAVDARARELRARLGDHAGPVVLSVGRLVPRKGFDAAINSLAALRRDFPQVRYVVIGDGPERQRLADLAHERGVGEQVLLLGRADDAMKWAAYECCDLFVMPNRSLDGTDWEGFGIVFAEAARAGRAVVAGRNGGVADAVIDGETGLLVDADDPAALAAAIRRLLEHPEERRRMGAAAAQLAAERFTPAGLRRQLIQNVQWN